MISLDDLDCRMILDIFFIKSWRLFFDGLISRVSLYFLKLKPKKSKPLLISVMWVFLSESSKPTSFMRNSFTSCFIFIASSLLLAIMIKSSAYLTIRCILRLLTSKCIILLSRHVKAILASIRLIIPPCGVPVSVGVVIPSSRTPALNIFWITSLVPFPTFHSFKVDIIWSCLI